MEHSHSQQIQKAVTLQLCSRSLQQIYGQDNIAKYSYSMQGINLNDLS